MAKFITDTKNKVHDLFVYVVSCGKSSKEPGTDQRGLAQDHGLVIIPGNAQDGYAPIVPIIIGDEPRNEQGNNGPIVPIGEQQDFAIFPPGDERNNFIDLPEDAQEKDKENNNEEYHGGPVHPDGKAYTSRPPGKRSPPGPKTGSYNK
ncbi:uncharacterized protein LOC132614974 [Lycium barbarum]|uniref:uncharacterized protein LOC132614974 n=1 Tax=Lycium barbarum TaxID=112863 RepID=UPI00293F3A7B|nr:uncharacterized protein LOC132614974 [Lycium barbarum]